MCRFTNFPTYQASCFQMDVKSRTVENFGRNIVFQPRVMVAPRSDDEVLECLKKNVGRQIRVIGRLHSWSETLCGEDVIFDLQHLNSVTTEVRDGRVWATIGAGCQIKRALSELERQANATLPTVGLISEQSIAGAMATGTHGSGRSSLSHYAAEVRIATYDAETGEPVIRTVSDGPELRAARCSLGCLGVILSVGLWARPSYRVEEYFARYGTLKDVIVAEAEHPLQQFYLIPWSWDFYAQHRREVAAARSRLARVYRLYFFLTFDFGMHLVLLFLSRVLKSQRAVKFFYRRLLPWTVIRGWKVVDRSSDMLIMEHELFVHIEIEIIVRRSQLAEVIPFVIELLRHFDGDRAALSAATREQLNSHGLLEALDSCAGTYTHHYPICVRRIQPDDTLMSMASGDGEDWYSISIVSCAGLKGRDGFFRFANHIARTAAALFQARPHWGKYCPIDGATASALYPGLPEFQSVCNSFDPTGRFRNAWAESMLFGSDRQTEAQGGT